MKTATEIGIQNNLREMRARSITSLILSKISEFLSDDQMRAVHNSLVELLKESGADIISDNDRRNAGLPPRGPYGWTYAELHALEAHRLETLLKPLYLNFMVVKDDNIPRDEIHVKDDKGVTTQILKI